MQRPSQLKIHPVQNQFQTTCHHFSQNFRLPLSNQSLGSEAEAVVKQLLVDISDATRLDKIFSIGEVEGYPDLLVEGDHSKHAYLLEVKNDFRRKKPDGSFSYGDAKDVEQICDKNWTSNSFPLRGTGRTVREGASTRWQVDYITTHKGIVKALVGTFPSYEETAWNKLLSEFGNNLIWSGHGIIPPSHVTPRDKACQDKTLRRLRLELKQFCLRNGP